MKTILAAAAALVSLAAFTTAHAEGGCGVNFHRTAAGYCVPNWGGGGIRPCPPGYHLGPEGKRCWPN